MSDSGIETVEESEKIEAVTNKNENTHIINVEEELPHNEKEKTKMVPHNGKKITKMVVSSKYVVTYSHEDESFVGWCINKDSKSGPLKFNEINEFGKVKQPYYKHRLLNSDSDFKVSNKKAIMYEDNEGGKVKTVIYDMEKTKKDDDNEFNYKFTNFLTNGDLVTIKIDERKSVILIYSSISNNWVRSSVYEINEKIIFGKINDNRYWILSNKNLFTWNLSTFQYRKFPLEINEKEVNIDTISLKFSKSLTVVKVDGVHYIYSNKTNFLIKSIKDLECQEFDIVGENDEYMITLSSDDKIKIYFSKSNLEISRNILLTSLLEMNDNNENSGIDIKFKFNGKKAFGVFGGKPWMIDMNEKIRILNDTLDDTEGNINENIFYNIGNQFITPMENENEFINKYIFPNLVNYFNEENEIEFIKNYIFPNLVNFFNEQNGYDIIKLLNNENEIILKVANSTQNEIISYNTELLESFGWKNLKVNRNTYILYNETVLHIYIFNMKLKKIKLQYVYNVEFFKYAIKLYSNDKLKSHEIKEVAQPIENDGLKKQWVLYLLSQKYFLTRYGEDLLKLAIKQNNIKLIEAIFSKSLGYFKENPKQNIHILSVICKNMKYLDDNYSDILEKYYNEMMFFMNDSNSVDIIHDKFQHLHSFCKELSITKNNFLYRLFHLFWKLIVGLIISIILLILCWKFSNWSNIRASITVGSFLTILIISFFLLIMYSPLPKIKPMLLFIVPFPSYMTYPKRYSYFKEFFKPQSSPFSQAQNNEIYKTLNGEAIINFKWRVFGRYYYTIIWSWFIIYLICFTLASSIPSNIINKKDREKLFKCSIFFGLVHLSFKFRQFIWNPIRWIYNIWNLFDFGAYLIPVITSLYWIRSSEKESIESIQAISSISCLLLDIRFLLFFRAFESFGIYFAIMLGVAKRIISFLFIMLVIILSFAHAFLILLKSSNENTNLFSEYFKLLLATYSFLTGEETFLEEPLPNYNPIMMILMIVFSFVVVVYLMNLFIGLLNKAINVDNDRAFYLAQKAEILKEIELFYLLPHQRRWKTWFPDIIYYYADVNKTRQAVKKLTNEGTWKTNDFPEMRENLLKLLGFENS